MACERIRLSYGSSAIVCGIRRSRKKTAPCRFCGQPSTKLCDWKCEVPVEIPHEELREEDTVVTQQKSYRLKVQGLRRFSGAFRQRFRPGVKFGTGVFEITSELDRYPSLPLVHQPVTMYGLALPDKRCFLYYLDGDGKVTVLRPGTCDAPICELHAREAGEGIDYCREHWHSWEGIA